MCTAYQYNCTAKSGTCEDPGNSEEFKYSYTFFEPESCMILLALMQQISRHTVVCQQPRKPCDTQVCYLQEPLPHRF